MFNLFSRARKAIQDVRESRLREEEMVLNNPYLLEAMQKEKLDGHRIATIARTVALVAIGLFLPFQNFNWNVLFYEFFLLVFIGIGWLQFRVARVGQSRAELGLIFLDLVLLTTLAVVPNPGLFGEIPGPFTYRFQTFMYFFIFLALATLAFSWRTVYAIGTWVAGLWVLGILFNHWFGYQIPILSENAMTAFAGYEVVQAEMDPNGLQVNIRIQEIVIFVIVAAILGLKGQRSNRLLLQQAAVAEQRANLSRYFPANMVETLSSNNHDVGAVRSQEVAVLFTDIVGFTKIAEQRNPEQVMALLRDYHAVIERAIFENNGTLDKYLGDGVMATFGTPEPGPDDAKNAMKAAKQIVEDMKNFRSDSFGHDQIHVSVGVHYGSVTIGDIGPSRRLEFAVVGDTVNVASRLEAASRELGCNLVVSDALVAKLNETVTPDMPQLADLEERRDIHLRGREKPLDVWIN